MKMLPRERIYGKDIEYQRVDENAAAEMDIWRKLKIPTG